MRRDYDELPIIPQFQGVAAGAKQYWEASLAYRGHEILSPQFTVGKLFEVLKPLQTQAKSHRLREQAEQLSDLVVSGKRTKTLPRTECKVIRVDFRTEKDGQEIKSQVA